MMKKKILLCSLFVLSVCSRLYAASPAGLPDYPQGYPITKAMKNPLFWEFPSPMVNASGALIPGSNGKFYTADASARVWNIDGKDILFVYASHDMEQSDGCDRMDRYHVFSTEDMENWTDYGEIFNADDVPWHTGIIRNNVKFMWAPDCVYKNGKYYYYFPHISENSNDGAGHWGNNWQTGIAVSDYPASNFTILPEWLKGLNNGSQNQIDPCVFIDDDGQAYFYNGGGGRCFGGKLKDNMIEIDGDMQEMKGLANFHEGTWVHKYNGKYYLSHPASSGSTGDHLRYAISDNPLGPWTDKGVYVYATGCGTNHGSIVEFKGQWYAFYHSEYVSNFGALRSVHVDKLYYNPDGSIKIVNTFGTPFKDIIRTVKDVAGTTEIALKLEAEDFNEGGPTYGYYDTSKTQKNTYRPTIGMTIESRGSGYNLGDLAGKEFTRYTIYAEKTGLYDIDCYVASMNSNGRFYLNTNGVNKSGIINAPNTGDWGDKGFQKTTAANIPLKAGENLLEMRIDNGGFNIDRFEFRNAQPYAGKVYTKGNHNVPGTIEAENYDIGGQGISYFQNPWGHYAADVNAGGAYRTGPNEGVDIENKPGGGYNVSHTNAGEWIKYTITVTQEGMYDVDIWGTANGSVYLEFDDLYEYPPVNINTNGLNDYKPFTVKEVALTEGIHVMTLHFLGGPNIDKMVFTRKSDTSFNADKPDKNEITTYPNPTTGIVFLSQQAGIKVYNVQGVMLQESFGSQIDLSEYPAGVYLLSVNNDWIRVIKN